MTDNESVGLRQADPQVSIAPAVSQSSSAFAAFAFPDFRLFQAGALLSTVGLQMQAVAIGWQMYALTGEALDLGYVGLALFAPAVLLSAVTGHAADRLDRRRLLIACHAVLSVASLLLYALAEQVRSPLAIYGVLVLIGAARAFQGPASQALMPNLVPVTAFPNAVAWSSSTWQVAVVGGPALGGVLYANGGAGGVYACATALEIVTLLVLLRLRIRSVQPAQPRSADELSAGLRFVLRQPVILGAISLDLFAVLFGGAVALLPIYARDILFVGPDGLGLLRSAPAVGALVVALVLAHRPVLRRSGATMFACVALFGLATIVFGLSRQLWASLAALTVAGAADMVSVYIRHSLVQLRTPDVMRGRVAAVNMVFIGASNELGEFESGAVAHWLGTVPAVVLGGVATCVVVLLWCWWFPALRQIDRIDATA